MIKAIDTHYKGYKFRSRLEARWAVVFDNAGISWVYEPQGYVVNGKPYLPDFYLDGIGFFEVKGGGEIDQEVMQELADQSGQFALVAYREIPEPEKELNGYLQSFQPTSDDDCPMAWGFRDVFLKCDGCGKITVENEVYDTMKGNCCDGCRQLGIHDALKAGRSARFEHGA